MAAASDRHEAWLIVQTAGVLIADSARATAIAAEIGHRRLLRRIANLQLSFAAGQPDGSDTLNQPRPSFFTTELESGHCLRTPAEGPCECDLHLRCPKFFTTSEYVPGRETASRPDSS